MTAALLRAAMARIVVHTHGRARERGYADLVALYAERLAARGVKLVQHSDKLGHDAYLEKLQAAASGGELILLDEKGESGSTDWMVDNWRRWRISGDNVHLAIGPVDGFGEEAVAQHTTIGLGPLTMTYEMAAVILLEQLYRASEIERGSPYHRK